MKALWKQLKRSKKELVLATTIQINQICQIESKVFRH
ncbi:hypothetical protein [Tolypothrix bouteillei]